MAKKTLNIKEAAKTLGLTSRQVTAKIKTGKMSYSQRDKKFYIPAGAL